MNQDEGTIEVLRTKYESGELIDKEEYTETVRVPILGQTGRVNVRGSVTRNLGDFNSIRVEVGFELPCLPELSEADRVYKICSNFVEDKLKAELDSASTSRSPYGETTQKSGGIRRRQLNI